MTATFEAKKEALFSLFKNCKTVEEKYQKIIDMGRAQKRLQQDEKNEKNQVVGCQNTMYLVATHEKGALFFRTESDALISAGLAQILVDLYSGEFPETILKNPPTFMKEIGLLETLTPGRANGFSAIYDRMKEEAFTALQNMGSNERFDDQDKGVEGKRAN